MAASNVKHAFGTLFKKGATTIAEVVNISGPNISRDFIDVTHQESPSKAREFITNLIDGGEITLELNFLPANSTQKDLIDDIYVDTAQSYSVVWIDGPTTWSFTGFIQSAEPSAPVDNKLSLSVTIKITGLITLPA